MLMCIASAILIRTAKALRGYYSYVDAFFPLLLMHMGLATWWWGMIMQFVLPTFLLCVVMSGWSVVSIHINGVLEKRNVLGIVLPMILLPLSGSNGLAISVGVIALVVLILYWYWLVLYKRPIIMAILCMSITITLSIWFLYFFKFSTVTHYWGNLTPTAFLKTTGHMIVAPFGTFVSPYWLRALALLGLLVLWLLFAIIRSFRSWPFGQWRFIGGMIVLCFSTIGLAFAIGYGRGGREWTAGFAGHYSPMILPLYAGIFLLAVRLSMSKFASIMFFLINTYANYEKLKEGCAT